MVNGNGFGIIPAISHAYRPEDIPLIENGLPSHVMVLMCIDLKKNGWEMRRDVLRHLNTSAASALVNQWPDTIKRVAKQIDDLAKALLHDASPDDPRDGLLACAFWTLKLIELGLWGDVNNTAVLAALHILEDAKEDPNWRMNEKWLEEKAGKMLQIATLNGLYAKNLAPRQSP